MIQGAQTAAGAPPPQLARQIDAVSASLRKAYSATVAEEIPDQLLDLLNKLK